MTIIKKIVLSILAIVLYVSFNNWTSSPEFTQNDAEVFNSLYKYTPEQLKVKCDQMSRWSHISGITDGAFSPFGKTYYYKSKCYMTLAQITQNPDLCKKVRSRFSIINRGNHVSEKACLHNLSLRSK